MDISEVPAGSIVVGVDGSPWSDGALRWATDQAALEGRTLTILHTVEAPGAQGMGLYAAGYDDYARIMEECRGKGQQLLDDAVSYARSRASQVEIEEVLSVSDPRSVLLNLGQRAAMIVLGSRGRGPIASLVLGSVSVAVAKHAACPVVVRRSTEPTRAEHPIAVGVDGTTSSVGAIEFAYRMASFRRCALTVLHCYWTNAPVAPPSDGSFSPSLAADQALVSESIAGMAEKFPDVEVDVRLVYGFADRHLIDASPDFDLVVIGHRRLGPLGELIYGSLAPSVLEHAEGAIAVVPWAAEASDARHGI